ncbi:MAG TPA: hypothetical protein PKC96_01555 [Bacilli bacterium]|nr:hypothetical protein [Bacilli bacterium]
MARNRKSDTIDLWKKSGSLESKLSLVSSLVSHRSSQIVISEQLGISPKTSTMLKNRHLEIRKAIEEGEETLKNDLIDVVYKRAVGVATTDEVIPFEAVNDKQKKRIVKTKKAYPPDVDACKYLLTIKFGKEFSSKRYELEILEKKIFLTIKNLGIRI